MAPGVVDRDGHALGSGVGHDGLERVIVGGVDTYGAVRNPSGVEFGCQPCESRGVTCGEDEPGSGGAERVSCGTADAAVRADDQRGVTLECDGHDCVSCSCLSGKATRIPLDRHQASGDMLLGHEENSVS